MTENYNAVAGDGDGLRFDGIPLEWMRQLMMTLPYVSIKTHAQWLMQPQK